MQRPSFIESQVKPPLLVNGRITNNSTPRNLLGFTNSLNILVQVKMYIEVLRKFVGAILISNYIKLHKAFDFNVRCDKF